MSVWKNVAFTIRSLRYRIGDSASDTERARIISTSSSPSASSLTQAGTHPLNHHWNNGHHNNAFESEGTTNPPMASVSRTTNPRHNKESATDEISGQCSGGRDFASSNSTSNHAFMPINAGTRISVLRDPVDMVNMERKYGLMTPESPTHKVTDWVKSRCSCSLACLLSLLLSLVPILSWLPKYQLQYVLPDMIAGFTIAILHIPQGMAYGILASVQAQNGLYVSFFPVLVYFIFGTSRHVSIGTFAVISLMLSSAVDNVGSVLSRDYNSTLENGTSPFKSEPPTHLEVATSMAMGVGLLQLLMGTFQLGTLAVVLSDHLVSGFTTGAALHVATSQLKDLFGISVGRYSGILKIVYIYRDIFYHISSSNVATVIVSGVAIFVLAVAKEHFDEYFKKKVKMPLPIDLIVVVVVTGISYAADFNGKYHVKIMGPIPTGLPAPVPPRMDLLLRLFADSFAIAIVAFAISLSMAKLFAKKHNYEISATQELIALGCANIVSSFFACYPCSASLSRSLVQERAGGKTQVAGVVSCLLLLVVLLALAPMFYTLPKCILSAVILVALKAMFLQVRDFAKAWKVSKIDSLLWLVTFISTVLLDVSYGLLAGVIFSVITVVYRTALPSKTFLGNIPDTDIYIDIERYRLAQEIPGVKIFHFESALYFINREFFKSTLIKSVPFPNRDSYVADQPNKAFVDHVQYIIIDCSSFSFVDMSGLETLKEVMKEYKEVGITVFLSGCSVPMYDLMVKANFISSCAYQPCVFPTIHDAVGFCYFPSSNIQKST